MGPLSRSSVQSLRNRRSTVPLAETFRRLSASGVLAITVKPLPSAELPIDELRLPQVGETGVRADRWSSGGPAEERQGISLSQLLAMALEATRVICAA